MSWNILRAGEFVFANSINLASYNMSRVFGAGILLQAGAVHLQRTNPQVAKDTQKYTNILLIFNAIGAFWTFGSLAKALQEKYDLTLMSPKMLSCNWTTPDWSMGRIFSFNAKFLVAGTVSFIVLHYLTDTLSQLPHPRRAQHAMAPRGNVSQSYEAPFNYRLSRTLYMSQLILNLALVHFGTKRMESLLSVVGLAATLFSSAKMEWLSLSARSTGQAQEMNYKVLLVPETSICSHGHVEAKEALITRMRQAFHAIVCHADDNAHYLEVPIYRDGRRVGTDYKLSLPRNLLPKCSGCDERPASAQLSCVKRIQYTGAHNTPKSDFGASLYLTYSIIQLSLVVAQQKYPHLAGVIFKAQKVMIGLDVIAFMGKVVDYHDMYQREWGTEAILGALAASALAVGYLIYLHKTEGTESLVDHLKGTVPESNLSNLTITKTPPVSFRVMQWMLLNKILLDLALAPNTENESLHLASAVVGMIALYRLSQLQFISFERKMSLPLQDRSFKLFDLSLSESAEAARLNFESTLTDANPRFRFVVSQPLSDEAMKSTLQGIYDYSNKFFDDSYWQYYWLVTYRHGVEVGRQLIMNAQVVPRSLMIGEIDYAKLICSWGGTTYKKWMGSSVLNLQYQ
ncbi:MAG: hypothetical protein KDK64_03360 [Chlamydiia bacterium]|nr:hypothetical protein [Chlamydiia bacterium]